MEKILDFKKDYFFWIKRYSIIQIGSYSFSLISYILYLVPSLDNDPLIYSFFITTISLVRLKIYLNDVVAFFPKDKIKINKDLLLKKLIVFVFLTLMTLAIYLYIAKIGIVFSLLLSISMVFGTYISYQTNSELHEKIRENKISKKGLFLFGFLPRLSSTLLLFIYVFFVNSKDKLNWIILLIIVGLYLLPPLTNKLVLKQNLFSMNLIKSPIKELTKICSLLKNFSNIKYTNYLNLFSLLILNISFFLNIIKLKPITSGNIFKLPISISLVFSILFLISRITTAYKYSIENYIKSDSRKLFTWLMFFLSISCLISTLQINSFYSLYFLALIVVLYPVLLMFCYNFLIRK